jgi:IS4 transposase
MIVSNFSEIVKKHLSHLPQDDYPVLNTFKFASIWLSFVLDQSQTSMRSQFKRLNIRGEKLDNSLVGTGQEQVEARVVWFCDREEQTEFRLVTNLPEEGEKGISNSEIGDFYRLRWQIELFWKFLKMHLKLARFITQNTNGIEIQIYACLIAYVLLQLVNIPKKFEKTLLDKLLYLQAFMCEKISYVHWFNELVLQC